MLPELTFKGLTITDERKAELNQKVWKLKELCPSDANVEVIIEKRPNFYFVSITIHHQEGPLSARGEGADLNRLSHDCFDKIHHSLRNWKRGRFLHPTLSDDAFVTEDNHMKYI